MTEEELQIRLASLPEPSSPEDYEEAVIAAGKGATPEQRARLMMLLENRPAQYKLTPEQRISRALRCVLEHIPDGAQFLQTRELRRVNFGLEFFLSSVLAETYPYWKIESLDGFRFAEARRLGPEQAEFFGMCILISDQALTPFYVQLKIAPSEEKITSLECRLGKRGPGAGEMERVPCQQERNNPFFSLPKSKECVDWVYKISLSA